LHVLRIFSILLHELIDEGFFGKVFRADLIRCLGTKKEKLDAAVKMLKGVKPPPFIVTKALLLEPT